MGRTEFEIEITGLKIKYKGEREDVPRLTNAVRDQLGSVVSMPSLIPSDNNSRALSPDPPVTPTLVHEQRERKAKSKSKSSAKSNGQPSAASSNTFDWQHEPEKWGNPLDSWNPRTKAIWLLFVVENALDIKEMTASEIASTFNKHFREARPILASNVSRDLKAAKKLQPPAVQNDTTKDPQPWFLTSSGKAEAQRLVAEARGISN